MRLRSALARFPSDSLYALILLLIEREMRSVSKKSTAASPDTQPLPTKFATSYSVLMQHDVARRSSLNPSNTLGRFIE